MIPWSGPQGFDEARCGGGALGGCERHHGVHNVKGSGVGQRLHFPSTGQRSPPITYVDVLELEPP